MTYCDYCGRMHGTATNCDGCGAPRRAPRADYPQTVSVNTLYGFSVVRPELSAIERACGVYATSFGVGGNNT